MLRITISSMDYFLKRHITHQSANTRFKAFCEAFRFQEDPYQIARTLNRIELAVNHPGTQFQKPAQLRTPLVPNGHLIAHNGRGIPMQELRRGGGGFNAGGMV
jgi:hypothetical protein